MKENRFSEDSNSHEMIVLEFLELFFLRKNNLLHHDDVSGWKMNVAELFSKIK